MLISLYSMKISRFGLPAHEKTDALIDVGRRVEDSAFGADHDERFIDGGGMKIQ
jgi:hypothetical protein